MTNSAVFFWGSREANSQTNSPQEADDRPKRSSVCEFCGLDGLLTARSANYVVCRLHDLWTVSVDRMVCGMYDLRLYDLQSV